jgi:hypothetical protein
MHKLTEAVAAVAAGPWEVWVLLLLGAGACIVIVLWPGPRAQLDKVNELLDRARTNLEETDRNLIEAIAKNAEADQLLAEVADLRVEVARIHEEAQRVLASTKEVKRGSTT